MFIIFLLKSFMANEIAKVLHWGLWGCFIMSINNDCIILQGNMMRKVLKSTFKKLWCLTASKKINLISNFFFLRYWKDITNLLFWELLECLIIPIKNQSTNLQETFMLICIKQIYFITSFWSYCNEIANLLVCVIGKFLGTHT